MAELGAVQDGEMSFLYRNAGIASRGSGEGRQRRGKKKGPWKMWVKFKRLLRVFYVIGTDNTGHGAWERQTSISSYSNKVSELRWIPMTCHSHQIPSLLTSWPQHRAPPYKSPFPTGGQGKCRSLRWSAQAPLGSVLG